MIIRDPTADLTTCPSRVLGFSALVWFKHCPHPLVKSSPRLSLPFSSNSTTLRLCSLCLNPLNLLNAFSPLCLKTGMSKIVPQSNQASSNPHSIQDLWEIAPQFEILLWYGSIKCSCNELLSDEKPVSFMHQSPKCLGYELFSVPISEIRFWCNLQRSLLWISRFKCEFTENSNSRSSIFPYL